MSSTILGRSLERHGVELVTRDGRVVSADDCDRAMLGKGAFGTVYRVRSRSGNMLALKMMMRYTPLGSGYEGYNNQLRDACNEIRMCSRLRHPNVLRAYQTEVTLEEFRSTDEDSCAGLCVDLCEGNLNDAMRRCARSLPMSQEQIEGIVTQLIRGIAYLHENNIAHRDIHLGNILLSADGTVKISDFGESRAPAMLRFYQLGGLRIYQSPHQNIENFRMLQTDDMWRVGFVVMELLLCTSLRDIVSRIDSAGADKPLCASWSTPYMVTLREIAMNRGTPLLRTLMRGLLDFDYRKRPTAKALFEHSRAAIRTLCLVAERHISRGTSPIVNSTVVWPRYAGAGRSTAHAIAQYLRRGWLGLLCGRGPIGRREFCEGVPVVRTHHARRESYDSACGYSY